MSSFSRASSLGKVRLASQEASPGRVPRDQSRHRLSGRDGLSGPGVP